MKTLKNRRACDLLDFYTTEFNAPLTYMNVTRCPYIQDDIRLTGFMQNDCGYYLPNLYYVKAYDSYPHIFLIYNGKKKFIGRYNIFRNGNAHFII